MRVAPVLVVVLAACSNAVVPSSPAVELNPTMEVSAAPANTVAVWGESEIDAGPGPVVTGGVASFVGVSPADVSAAVFLVHHQTLRNGVGITVFRADGLTSAVAAERYLGTLDASPTQPACNPPADRALHMAGHSARVTYRLFVDQCQPHYVVLLDDETVAILSDDGGYMGNDPSNPPPVPYRPVAEIELLVAWVVQQLEDVELVPGGPPQNSSG